MHGAILFGLTEATWRLVSLLDERDIAGFDEIETWRVEGTEVVCGIQIRVVLK